jgi:hypothetical protein
MVMDAKADMVIDAKAEAKAVHGREIVVEMGQAAQVASDEARAPAEEVGRVMEMERGGMSANREVFVVAVA